MRRSRCLALAACVAGLLLSAGVQAAELEGFQAGAYCPLPEKGEVPQFAVRIPLAIGYAPEVEAVAWLRFLSKGLRSPELPFESHLFLRPMRGDRPAEMFLFHRELKDTDLGFLLSPTDDYPYANVLGDASEDPAAESFAEWYAEATGPTATLNDLLEVNLADWKTPEQPNTDS